jgi:hypothetical protein
VLVQSLTPRGYAGYLASFNNEGFAGDDAGHVILGRQPHPLYLQGAVGAPWPAAGQLPDPALKLDARGSKVVGRVRVGASPGLVLCAPPYPSGGVHGGHLIVLWNRRGAGYLVSLHFADRHRPNRYPQAARVAAALAIARSIPASG